MPIIESLKKEEGAFIYIYSDRQELSTKRHWFGVEFDLCFYVFQAKIGVNFVLQFLCISSKDVLVSDFVSNVRCYILKLNVLLNIRCTFLQHCAAIFLSLFYFSNCAGTLSTHRHLSFLQ